MLFLSIQQIENALIDERYILSLNAKLILLNYSLDYKQGWHFLFLFDIAIVILRYLGAFKLIDESTQQLRVTTYGVEAYSEEDLLENPNEITNLTPQIVSEFVVNPVLDNIFGTPETIF